jgi:hypothetical protein
MDNKIISFPRRPRRFEQNAAAKAALEAARARKLRVALSSRDAKRNFSELDQETAARNLHSLLEEYKRDHGVRKVDVARRAGLGGDECTDSTKRLYTYTLPDNAGPERRQRLAKKPDGYFGLARALAECASGDESSILCRVFLGCSFGTDEALDFDWETERWEHLARLLMRCAEDAITATGFDTCWREIRALPGSYDVRRGSIHFASGCLHFHALPLADAVIFVDEVPPLPSIPLARSLQAPPVSGTITLGDDHCEDAEFHFWRETRLAIGPVRALEALGPLLEIRTVLEVQIPDRGRVILDNPFTDGSNEGSDIVREAVVCGNRLPALVAPSAVPAAEYRDSCEHSYFAWKELSPAALRALISPGGFDRSEDWQYRHDHVFDRDPDLDSDERPHSWFLDREPAFYIHTSILSGTLERDLRQACEDLNAKVVAHKHALEQAISAQTRRWFAERSDSED